MDKKSNFVKTMGNISKSREEQIEYWTKRAENNFLAGEKDALEVAKSLKQNYTRAAKEIETKINLFYGKFASENKMSLQEAKKLLDRTELKSFKDNIKDILAMGKKEDFTDEQMKQFKILYAKTKISRLDELEANIKFELDRLTNTSSKQIGELLENTYGEGYYRTIFNVEQFEGFSSSFTGLNTQAIQKAVNTKWLGENYVTSLYKKEENLMAILNKEIPRGIILGYNPRKVADLASRKLDTDYNSTVRLVRTEYAKVLNDSTLDGYKACGIQRYQILAALDARTCNDCGEYDSKIVPISEGEPGVSIPPFHPNCRCTTIPYFEPDEFDNPDELIYNDKMGKSIPKDITYKEWKEGLTQPRNGKTHYKGGE